MISYSAWHAMMAVWDELSEAGKELALERLRYCLELRPWYLESIYAYVWRHTKDAEIVNSVIQEESLRLYGKKEREGRLAKIKDIKLSASKPPPITGVVSKKDWKGVERGGEDIYEEGNMYWQGSVDAVVNVPEGSADVIIEARGTPASGIYPYMMVELDGEEIGEVFVGGPEWEEYRFGIDTEGGVKVLSVTFTNDYAADGEDRNLYLGEARVVGVK
jgi:hypothetical protein